MREGILEFSPKVSPVPSISPSRFLSMQRCSLREVLAASRATPLLPNAPATRLGTVAHRLLEEAGKGKLSGAARTIAGKRWEELVAAAERSMLASWIERHLVPLSRSVADYEVRKLQAVESALKVAAESAKQANALGSLPVHCGFEMQVASADGLVRGQIDAVVASSGSGAIIRDYKSGAIMEDLGSAPVVKSSYRIQMMLYAALYAETTGHWPALLEIVPLKGSAQGIPFDQAGCSGLLDQAKDTLRRINAIIASTKHSQEALQKALAAPSKDNCSFCPYRPGCLPYRDSLHAAPVPEEERPKDFFGLLEDIRALGNSKLMLSLRSGAGSYSVRVRGLTPGSERHPCLAQLKTGDEVALFNLRAGGSQGAFVESPFTVIYKLPAAGSEGDPQR